MIPDFLRNHPLPDFSEVVEDDPIVMFFVINDDKSTPLLASSVLTASVQSCLGVLTNPDFTPQVEAWLGGRIRKIVKRARNAAWDKAVAAMPGASATIAGNSVIAYSPVASSAVASEVRKLQVTGLTYTDDLADAPEVYSEANRGTLHVLLRKDLGMSLGKQVAQACHVAQLFAMNGPEASVNEWDASGRRVAVAYVKDEAQLASYDAVVSVKDAGFTEVAPNTLTAAGVYL